MQHRVRLQNSANGPAAGQWQLQNDPVQAHQRSSLAGAMDLLQALTGMVVTASAVEAVVEKKRKKKKQVQ